MRHKRDEVHAFHVRVVMTRLQFASSKAEARRQAFLQLQQEADACHKAGSAAWRGLQHLPSDLREAKVQRRVTARCHHSSRP